METKNCFTCRRPKGVFACGICSEPICKKCLVSLEKESFSFLPTISPDLSHKTYCGSCYDNKIASELLSYQRTMGLAKQVFVYGKDQSEETRLMNRHEKPVRILNCNDKDETLLRLAFLAALANFNALIDVEITHKKVRDEGYQKTIWSGTGVPCTLDAKQIEKYK